MHRNATTATRAAVLALAVVCTGRPAFADDGLLETLAGKGVIDADEYQQLKAQQARQERTAATFSADKGLMLATGDGTYTLQFGVFQQIDFAAFDADGSDLSDGTLLRRSRLALGGKLGDDWQYRFQYEFAKASAAITDAYVTYSGFKPFSVTIGQAKLPFSMESLSSAAGTTFIERGLPAYVVSPILRAPGVQLARAGRRWSLAASATGEPLGDSASGDEGWGLAARATFAPYVAGHRVVHLGLGVNWRKPTQDNSGTTPSTSAVAFTARPESNQAPNFLNSGSLLDTTSYRLSDAEFATAFGAASLQGEYMWIDVQRDNGRDDLAFKTWYAQLAYTLTGETRTYNVAKGVFDGIKPAHPLGTDGWGAFEAAARLSRLDLDDGSVSSGNEHDMTLGLSWYLTPYLRVNANYVKVLKLDGGPYDGQKPSIYEMRVQLSF
ncbi:OprO/OprP family phosphate-selective porin [Solimonas terrae]|uniref:Porin n=1 Tax=Solimonas terrae TaxID=1396819 RepID=A0A6M2BWL1_9GAMM|nr:porin [Solimonas terrae]NGY06523.1 porin [Solimonas terrae]